MSVRTAEGWLAGAEPAASVLMRMAAKNDRLRAELLRALGETTHVLDAPAQASLLPPAGAVRPPVGNRAGAAVTQPAQQPWLRLGW